MYMIKLAIAELLKSNEKNTNNEEKKSQYKKNKK